MHRQVQCHGIARLDVVLVPEKASALRNTVEQGRAGQLDSVAVRVLIPSNEGLAPVAATVHGGVWSHNAVVA
jgi:hypothetical protein